MNPQELLNEISPPVIRKTTPNLVRAKRLEEPAVDGDRTLCLADDVARSLAQGVIDQIDDHVHLREAKILLLFKSGLKPDADGHVTGGTAGKAGPLPRLLAREKDVLPDFVVTLNLDVWRAMDPLPRVALLDHELAHCAATVAGKYTAPRAVATFTGKLGKDLIAVDHETRDDKDRVLVRYRKRKGDRKPGAEGYHDQPLLWRVRKHDVEEFVGVFGRWGAWDASLQRLVDVWDEPDEPAPLFDATEAQSDAA